MDASLRRRLNWALCFNASIIVSEFVGGLLLNSVGLMSDAGHNFIDQGALFVTLYSQILASKPAGGRQTFGHHRVGILAAFVNALILLVTSSVLVCIAIKRLLAPAPVPGGWIIAIALGGFAANLSIALLLKEHAEGDLNIRGVFWHMLGDAWVSFGVAFSGLGILLTGWTFLDPLVSFLIVGVIVRGSWPILTESASVLLEYAPSEPAASAVAQTVSEVGGVLSVHDLHLWILRPRTPMLTCHVLVGPPSVADAQSILSEIRRKLVASHGIRHLTIQVETGCCHPTGLHCDFNRLDANHEKTEGSPQATGASASSGWTR